MMPVTASPRGTTTARSYQPRHRPRQPMSKVSFTLEKPASLVPVEDETPAAVFPSRPAGRELARLRLQGAALAAWVTGLIIFAAVNAPAIAAALTSGAQ